MASRFWLHHIPRPFWQLADDSTHNRRTRLISYTESIDGITPDQLRGFFKDWGWPTYPSQETHLRLLQGSDFVFLAIDTGSDRVVGYITAISDGVLSA